jgi:YfiH family protein
MADTFELVETAGLTLAVCAPLGATGLRHAFSTRRADGRDDFDLGVEGRRARLLEAAGTAGRRASTQRQVHGSTLVRAGESAGADVDGLLWLRGDPDEPVPAIRVADCVPILIAARGGGAAAAVHAGWRGTAAGIAAKAVDALAAAGVPPCDLIVALGPAIGGCCYEVGPEVAAALGVSARTVDLREINRRQLLQAGVPAESVHTAPWCTRCRKDLFFSYRRSGSAAGRMLAVIGPPVS